MKKKHPKLTKFLRRMNRGLALGLAVVLIMAIWLGVSAARIRGDEAELRELTKRYVTELVEISSLMNSGEVGDRVSEDTAAAMKGELSDIVARYYSSSKAAQLAYRDNTYRTSGQKLVDGFDEWSRTADVFHLEEAEIFEKDEVDHYGNAYPNYTFYVEQKGAKHLEAYFSFQMKVTLVSRDPYSFNVYPFASKGGNYAEYYPDEKYPDQSFDKVEGGIYRSNATVNVTGRLIFVREGGEWKLACTQHVSAYVQSAQVTVITGKEAMGND